MRLYVGTNSAFEAHIIISGVKKVRNSNEGARETVQTAGFGFGRLGQQILNLLNAAGARAAERRDSLHLDRAHLDDCGLTPADLDIGLRDLNDNDVRAALWSLRRAA